MLWEKDADTKRPMASTTKLMTALLAAEELPLDAEITVPPEAVRVEGSSLGLRGGDRLTVRESADRAAARIGQRCRQHGGTGS